MRDSRAVIGAGTIINPLIKVVTTVAILAAIYLFIVKPTLDTTESISSGVANSINQSFGGFTPDVQKSVREARKLQKSAQQASQMQIQQANKLLGCINKAAGDVDKIATCNAKFSP